MGPIAFTPLFKDRVWGGRWLEEAFGKPLPDDVPIGESWEVVDREDAQSEVDGGPLAGRTLHDLWTDHREEVFGRRGMAIDAPRFPVLVKLLDAKETLSVQVHPPADEADALGGEPKSEMWFLADARPGAHLFVGLRAGVDRAGFERALADGEDVSEMLQRIDVEAGDAIYLPSGRVHAIGAGCLIVEVQQNSDTTYRVFDFDRPGLDGEPRELHVDESMRSIDWDDEEPALLPREGERVVATPYFTVDRWTLDGPRRATAEGECALLAVLAGAVACGDREFGPGDFFLVPAAAEDPQVAPASPGDVARLLRIELPEPR